MALTTTIENNELETELQELFLISKQWISELDFLEYELDLLNKLFKKAYFIISKGDFDKLSNLNKIHLDLKQRIQNYIQVLESLIVNPRQKIDSSLVDTYAQLAQDLEQIFKRLQTFKNRIFNLNKHNIQPATSVNTLHDLKSYTYSKR
ncbi:hypothetical protein [Pedobacter steynii]